VTASLKVREYLRIAGSLSKVRITLPVTASTFTGFYVYSGHLSPLLFPLLTGIFLLAAGSSALNHYQERDTDARMDRTRRRPVPGGKISAGTALLISIAAIVTGSIILASSLPLAVLFLGLFNIIWYNGVYTPLKKVTAFAVIPGSVTGGVPPVIGWVAAGGEWWAPEIISIFIFFVVGQIPHFWLLLLKFGNQYEKAGLPSLTALFSGSQIRRISLAWIVAAAAASALLAGRGLIYGPFLTVQIAGIALLLTVSLIHNVPVRKEKSETPPFMVLNAFYLLIMILLVASAAAR
jgi:heme o synthase